MKLRVALLFGMMLKAQILHHFIERDRIEALHDLQAVSGRKLHGLLFNVLKEVPLNASDVDLLELADFIFPIQIAHYFVLLIRSEHSIVNVF